MLLPTQNSPPSSRHHALGRRKLLPHSIRSKILFLPTAERGGGNYELLYQNSVRKYEDNLEHSVSYVLYDLQYFQMWWLYSFVK